MGSKQNTQFVRAYDITSAGNGVTVNTTVNTGGTYDNGVVFLSAAGTVSSVTLNGTSLGNYTTGVWYSPKVAQGSFTLAVTWSAVPAYNCKGFFVVLNYANKYIASAFKSDNSAASCASENQGRAIYQGFINLQTGGYLVDSYAPTSPTTDFASFGTDGRTCYKSMHSSTNTTGANASIQWNLGSVNVITVAHAPSNDGGIAFLSDFGVL